MPTQSDRLLKMLYNTCSPAAECRKRVFLESNGQTDRFSITRYVVYVIRGWKTRFFFGPDVDKFYAYLSDRE